MANKKIIWNAVAIFMGALAIALNVVDLLICLLFLFVSGVLVRIAFTRQDKTDNKKFEIRMTLVSLAIAMYTAYIAFDHFHFVDRVRWLFGLLT